MRRRIRRALQLSRRGLFSIALASKLLVPVGYMPAALADGALIQLCDSYAPVSPATAVGAPVHDHAHAVGAPVHDHAHAAGATVHEHGADAARGEDHEDHAGKHQSWKRCSLGGLASLAAVVGDWSFAALTAAPLTLDATEQVRFGRIDIFAFRPRAPPLVHS